MARLAALAPNTLASLAGQALASIEDPVVIEKILEHLKAKEAMESFPLTRLPPPRAQLNG